MLTLDKKSKFSDFCLRIRRGTWAAQSGKSLILGCGQDVVCELRVMGSHSVLLGAMSGGSRLELFPSAHLPQIFKRIRSHEKSTLMEIV